MRSPTGARDLLRQRLASLSDEDRRVLLVAAVVGSRFTAAQVAVVSELDEARVAAALDRAAALRVVERAAGTSTWTFVHDLFRQAALFDTPTAVAESACLGGRPAPSGRASSRR